MGWIIFLLVTNIIIFIGIIVYIYYCDDKNERLYTLVYLIFNELAIVMLSYCLKDIKPFVKMSCKEYSVETIVRQFENKSDTTYVLHLKR